MIRKDLQEYKQKMAEIQSYSSKDERTKALQELAKKAGASIIMTTSGHQANEAELTHNIHYALQTATMVDMCKTSSKNYKIAVVAAIAAALSALAAWIAVFFAR